MSRLITAAAALMAGSTLPGLPGGAPLYRGRARTSDNFMTFDARTIDSTGAFLVGELEKLDQRLHEPLVSTTWSRDIDLRSDVTIADEVSSWTNSSFAAPGGINPAGKNWIGKSANDIAGLALDIGKTAQPLTLWGMELSWTLPELASAEKVGRPVDTQKYDGMNLKWNMDTDEQVYTGDTTLGLYGLANSTRVTNSSNVANGIAGTPGWSTKTPDEILADVNEILSSAWAASAWAVTPSKLLVPPTSYTYLVSTKINALGSMSILTFLRENSIALANNGRQLDIQPVKWLIGAGAGATNRMVAYTQAENYVRFPMVPLQRTPIEYRSLYQLTTYYGRLGAVEFVYPETVAYRDGI